MISILADKNIYRLPEFIPAECRLITYNPDHGFPENFAHIDALIVRTVTPVTEKTLARLPQSLQFVATASSGSDHLDKPYLDQKNIVYGDAKGCNARSVAEYVATCLLLWREKTGTALTGKSIGIIGVGHVGSAVAKIVRRLDMLPVLYDPPRQKRDHSFQSASLDDLLNCDIISMHVPLNQCGPHATWHWLDGEKLHNQSFDMVINAARGGVTDEEALLQAHANQKIGHLVTDVWEHEPIFNDHILQHSWIATPHIAGYSTEAKTRASAMVMEKLCRHFDIEPVDFPEAEWVSTRKIEMNEFSSQTPSLTEILHVLHSLKQYEEKLRALAGLAETKKAEKFSTLRTNHPYRNEFAHIALPERLVSKYPVLNSIGCSIRQ